jgi:VWFA-related protein
MFALMRTQRLRRAARVSLCFAICAGFFPTDCFPSATASAQGAPQQSAPHILRSKVTLQTVEVQVTDKHGNEVRGLAAKDFIVREDGQRQQIAFFDSGAAPVTVAVLVDSSVSMSLTSKVGSAEQVAAEFARIARPGDDIYAMDFTEEPGLFESLTREQLRDPGTLTVPAGGSGSALYDAIATTICHLHDSKNPRQAIIVITDGIDENSRLTLNRLIEAVRSQRAQLFLIGFESRKEFRSFDHNEPTVELWGGHDIDNPDYVFYRLAKEAGAATFVLNSESGLQKALKAVSDTLNAEYTLAYYPPPTRRKVRHIRVRVEQRGVRVLASRTVVSDQNSGETVEYQPVTCRVSSIAYPQPYEAHISGKLSAAVYRDDFSDTRSGWPIHADSHYVAGGYELSTLQKPRDQGLTSGRWLQAGGGFPLANGAPLYRADVIAADGPPGPAWADFHLSTKVRLFEPPLHGSIQSNFSLPVLPAAGLVFRMSWKGYYAMLVRPSDQPKELAFELVARKFPGDFETESVIVPWTTIACDSPFEVQLAVQDFGEQIRLFIDGQQVGSARDDTFDNGYVGFIVDAPVYAIFSNFVLEQK